MDLPMVVIRGLDGSEDFWGKRKFATLGDPTASLQIMRRGFFLLPSWAIVVALGIWHDDAGFHVETRKTKNKKGLTKMKFGKMCAVVLATAIMVCSGCKSLPTADVMRATATSIGYAAGIVANETKIDDKARNTIVEVMNAVAIVVPQEGQTFDEAWTPAAKGIVAKLIADGKIDERGGTIALTAFGVAVKGVDYIFTVRYPKAREYEELVAAAVSGFADGFLTVFKPVDGEEAKSAKIKADEAAYKWLKANAKK